MCTTYTVYDNSEQECPYWIKNLIRTNNLGPVRNPKSSTSKYTVRLLVKFNFHVIGISKK